jgi:hypothetical protein
LTWTDLHAYTVLRGIALSPFDVTLIKTIDAAWLGEIAEARERDRKAAQRDKATGNG